MEYIGNLLYDESLWDENRKFVIFGTGKYGRIVLHFFEVNGIKNRIICFCDSNPQMDGLMIEGIPVCQTMDSLQKYPNADYLISGKYVNEMYRMLEENAIDKIHLLFV